MQSVLLILSLVSYCVCFEVVADNTRPTVEYSSLTYHSDESGEYLLSFGGQIPNVPSTISELWRFSLSTSKWELIPTTNSTPSLMQHTAITHPKTNSMIIYG
jgi:hypothetical protein